MTIPSVRDPEYLHPLLVPIWMRMMTRCRAAGLLPLLTFGYRSPREQDALYQIGRRGVEGEKIVTKAKGGQSWHNVERPNGQGGTRPAALAFDLVLLDPRGRAVLRDDAPEWQTAGKIGELLGLTWGGRWAMRDLGHFQLDDGGSLTLAQAMSGQDPQEVA